MILIDVGQRSCTMEAVKRKICPKAKNPPKFDFLTDKIIRQVKGTHFEEGQNGLKLSTVYRFFL